MRKRIKVVAGCMAWDSGGGWVSSASCDNHGDLIAIGPVALRAGRDTP